MGRFCVVGTVLVSLFVILLNSTIAGEEDISKKDKGVEEAPCCEKDIKDLVKDVKIEQLQKLPKLPNIVMMNQYGKSVRISEILKDKITVINFIYTSCTSVCQILTSNFRQLEKALESIDKNNDV
ncbi:MAG: SCO family protein, partial [Candidatus Anammoxibacter sp.]